MGRHNTWLWRLIGVGRLLHQPSANTVLAKEAVQKKKTKRGEFFQGGNEKTEGERRHMAKKCIQ